MGVSRRTKTSVGALASCLMAKSPEFARLFPVRDSEGRRVIVPATETDRVDAIAKLVEQSGGTAMLAVFGKTDTKAMSLTVARMTTNCSDDPCDHHVPVTHGCTIGDLLRVLLPGSSITLRLAGDELGLDEITEQEVGPEGELVPN